jgi:hypothetical protein
MEVDDRKIAGKRRPQLKDGCGWRLGGVNDVEKFGGEDGASREVGRAMMIAARSTTAETAAVITKLMKCKGERSDPLQDD